MSVIAVRHLKTVENPMIMVEFYDATTDAAIDLTGWVLVSASAQAGSTAAVDVPATLHEPAAGKVRLEPAAESLAAGTYRVEVTMTDADGRTRVLPAEDGQLLFKVTAANA